MGRARAARVAHICLAQSLATTPQSRGKCGVVGYFTAMNCPIFVRLASSPPARSCWRTNVGHSRSPSFTWDGAAWLTPSRGEGWGFFSWTQHHPGGAPSWPLLARMGVTLVDDRVGKSRIGSGNWRASASLDVRAAISSIPPVAGDSAWSSRESAVRAAPPSASAGSGRLPDRPSRGNPCGHGRSTASPSCCRDRVCRRDRGARLEHG